MKVENKPRVNQCICQDCQQHPYGNISKEHRAINRVMAGLNEKNRRRFVGVLALQWGHGAVQLLREITGLSRTTIARGRMEVQRADRSTKDRIRREGSGRPTTEKNSQRF
jgi:hypothetical protein